MSSGDDSIHSVVCVSVEKCPCLGFGTPQTPHAAEQDRQAEEEVFYRHLDGCAPCNHYTLKYFPARNTRQMGLLQQAECLQKWEPEEGERAEEGADTQ